MTSGGHEVDVGGALPDYKYVRNKPESGFLSGQAEYSQSFERPPDVIHVISVPRPSPSGGVGQALRST